MMRSIWSSVALCSLAAAAPADAASYLFDNQGDTATIDFDGFVGNSAGEIPGLSSSLRLRLLSGVGTGNFLFSYELLNTSSATHSGSRVSGFAFNSDPRVSNAFITLGDFSNIVAGGGNYPNGIGNVEVCLNNSNGNSCAGGGGGGATLTDPATGQFVLSFNTPINRVTLDSFYVRYQSLPTREGSASGRDVTTAVPEPGSWMLMLMGFFALGFALRRRSEMAPRRQAYA